MKEPTYFIMFLYFSGMQLYIGRITRALQPSRISALGSAYITSPSPPVFTKG